MENVDNCHYKRRFTIRDKKEILRKVEEMQKNDKFNMKQVSKTLNLPRSTLLTIINNRNSIEATPDSDKYRFRAKNKRINPCRGKGKYQVLEEALCDWISQRHEKAESKRLLGSHVRKQALTLAKELGFSDFTASNGWCDRFKKKYNIEYKSKEKICKHESEFDDKCPDVAPEDFLKMVLEENPESRRTTSNSEQYGLIFRYLRHWVMKIEATSTKVNGTLLKEMALALAGALGVESFTGSNGWIDKFQKRRALMKYNECPKCNSKG